MDNQNSGWNKIAEQEAKGQKKSTFKKNADTAANVTSYVSWIVFLVVFVVVIIALFGTGALDYFF